jgi:hypothetical protein
MSSFERFLLWERSSRDTIEVKRVYVDMAGDLIAGVVLSQIVYWHLPTKEGNARLQVEREGKLWLAKGRTQWWDECRISPKQADRALDILQEKGLIQTRLFKFAGAPMRHIRIDQEEFLKTWEAHLQAQEDNKGQEKKASRDGFSPKVKMDFPQRSKSNSPKGQNGILPLGKMNFTESDNSFTETTTEITTETTAAAEAGRENRNGHPTEGPAAALIQELLAHDLNHADAVRLAREKPGECRRQLDFLPFKIAALGGEQHFTSGKGAYLRAAIEGSFAPPPGYKQEQARRQKAEQEVERKRVAEARRSHQEHFYEAYRDYLRSIEEDLAAGQSEAYQGFRDQEQKTRTNLGRLRVKKPLEEFETEAAHQERLIEYFRQVPDCPVPDFWEWDARHNPQPFGEERESPSLLQSAMANVVSGA